jgi:triacylglycerol esterase/lipase EstA (alpha/beta hydrolase family)
VRTADRRDRSVRLVLICALLLALGTTLLAPPSADAQQFDQNGVIFVHGIEGTGAQFESQAMRLTSNGYPAEWIDEVDYNSTRAAGDPSEVEQQIDRAIAEMQERTGRPQVDVVGHSLGTRVMERYLTDSARGAERRAKIGRYVNVDGQSSNPGVPTLAIWAGRGTAGRNMEGAQNVTIPNQTHVQVCTSPESFVEMYKFLTGKAPAHDIVPQKGSIRIAGKTVDFPSNSGTAGATTEIWEIDANGRRTSSSPLHSLAITDGSVGGGDWGPVTVEAGRRYEFVVTRPGGLRLHAYREPFVRSDHTVRLLVSTALGPYVAYRPGAVTASNIRYKELWGDQPGESDQLLIDGTNICTPELCPISKQVNAFLTFDGNRNGQTDLTRDPVVGSLPFIQAADVFVPANAAADGTVAFELRSRGGGPARVVNTANWESTEATVQVQWHDFEPHLLERVTPPRSRCRRPERLRYRIRPHSGHAIRVTVYVDGKRVKTVRGKRIRSVAIKRPRRTRFTVKIVTRTSHGVRTTSTRRYNGCKKTPPKTRTERP